MINTETLLKARLEVTRLNGELRELHLEEERCQLKRTRLEGDKARVQVLVDICELAQGLAGKPLEQVGLSFRIEETHGAKLVVVDKPASAPMPVANAERKPVQAQKRRPSTKPDGLPTVAEMVLAVLEGEKVGMRPCDITKVAQRKWWPNLRPAAVNATVWRLAGSGRLEKDGHLYKLNGRAGE